MIELNGLVIPVLTLVFKLFSIYFSWFQSIKTKNCGYLGTKCRVMFNNN